MTRLATRDRLVIPLSVIITGGWIASLISGVITQSYIGVTVATPVMLLVAGYVFGVQIVKGVENHNGK